MDAVVVYESLWGNTEAVARAIAHGFGDRAMVLPTTKATEARISSAQLIVAGAPVHALGLPTGATRESARTKPQGHENLPADLTQDPLRDWLETVPPGPRYYAAFETHIRGPLGRGATRTIAAILEGRGYTALTDSRGFTVRLRTGSSEPGALLMPGEEQVASRWGEYLASLLAETASQPATT